MPIDKVCVNLLDLPKKRLALEVIVFHGKEAALVNLALFDNGAAFAYLPVLPRDFFLGAYPFACFIKEYAAAGNLDFWLGKQLSFAENEMDMIIRFSLVVVEGRHALHIVPSAKFLCKILQHHLRLILRINLWQGDNQFPCFDTFPLCAAALKFLLAFPCEVVPKRMVCGAVGGVKVFLLFLAGDIVNPSLDIGQLRHLYK